MFKSLFKGKPELRPMSHVHLGSVLNIIEETDEDDREDAEEHFASGNFENMYVLMENDRVLGVTGTLPAETDDDVLWLAWTYLREDRQGEGLGAMMLGELLEILDAASVKKLFISSSDYSEDGVCIYAAAHALYEKFDAKLELTIPNYYAMGESQLIYGLRNTRLDVLQSDEFNKDDEIRLTNCSLADDSDGIFSIAWEIITAQTVDTNYDNFANDLANMVPKVTRKNARSLVFAAPSDIKHQYEPALQREQFQKLGSLNDFYGEGISQDWWLKQL